MLERLKALWKDEEAPTAVEYGVMVALIAVAIIATVYTLGGDLKSTFNTVDAQLKSGG